MIKIVNIVAAKKQKNADSVDDDSLPLVDAMLTILNTAVIIPPIAWPWNKEPIYVAGNNPANAANDP